MKKIILSTLLASCCFTADAGDKNSPGYVAISEIKVWEQAFDVYLTEARLPNCNNANVNYFRVNTANPDRNNHTAMLMAAFMSGKTVSLSYTCDSNGQGYVDGVRVR